MPRKLSCATVATAAVALVGLMPSLAAAEGTLTSAIEVRANIPPGAQPTKRKPTPTTVDMSMRWTWTGNEVRPTLQKTTVLFPPGSIYNGGKLPSCSMEHLNNQGIADCPKGSIMGRGKAWADADTVPTIANITVVNGGAKRVYFYTTMTNPAVVQTPVEGKIRKLGGKWAYELTVEVPTILQVVAGVPIIVNRMEVKITNKKWLALSRPPSAVSVTNVLGPPHA